MGVTEHFEEGVHVALGEGAASWTERLVWSLIEMMAELFSVASLPPLAALPQEMRASDA